MISFFVPAIPRGQARVRHAVISGHSRAYKAEAQVHDEQTLQALMMPYVPVNPFVGAISLKILIVMPVPKSKPKRWKIDALGCRVLPTTKPDASNVCKHVEDVLQSMRFFDDDRQICKLEVMKRYGEPVGYHIELMEL
jgi:Holliday junction resolvase RusA-like endonuclease